MIDYLSFEVTGVDDMTIERKSFREIFGIPASQRCKVCSTCHIERPPRDFRRTTLIKGGYELTCKLCQARTQSEVKLESRLDVALNTLDDVAREKTK